MEHLTHDWEVKVLDDLDPDLLLLVCDFFNTQFPGVYYPKCTPQIFEWKLSKSNPAGTGFLTVAISNGLVVGTASGTRKILSQGGRSFEAIEIGDTFTHPSFRKNGNCTTPLGAMSIQDPYFSVSIFGRLVSETIARAHLNGIKFIYGTPNANSYPPYLKRLKFKEVNVGQISLNLILTPNFHLFHKLPWVIRPLELMLRAICYVLRFLTLGRNSIYETTKEDFITFFNQQKFSSGLKQNVVCLGRTKEILEHRYVSHPNHVYRFFKIKIKDKDKGVLITTEILRSNGFRSFVVSDWLISDRKVERRLSLILPSLLRYVGGSEVITYWEQGGYNKVSKFLIGTFKYGRVSLISMDNRFSDSSQVIEFENFRMGWSDNG